MKIWKIYYEGDVYDSLMPVKKFTVDEIQSFDGRSHKKRWKPLKVKRMEPEKGLSLSDFPGFTIPVLSQRALDVLYPLIANNVEILPLSFADMKYYAVNVTKVLDAINYKESEYLTYSDGKRIMFFEKYSFHEKIITGESIFKIIDEKVRGAFVSDEFKTIVEKNALTGFIFEQVWSSN